MNADISFWIGVGFAAAVALAILWTFLAVGRLWLQALLSGAPVSMIALIGMKFRRVDARQVVRARIIAAQSGVSIPTRDLERAYLVGADLEQVTLAYVDAIQRGSDVTFDRILDAERSGRLRDMLR